MHPFINLGLVNISTFGLLAALAWITSLFVFWLGGRKEQPDEEALLDLALLATLGGLVLARIWYVVGHWTEFGIFDWFRFFSRPGLDWQGFLFGFLLTTYRFTQVKKWSFWKTADLLSPALLIGEAIGGLGCHLNGCLTGKQTSLPWGVMIAGYPGQRHPIALYQASLALLFLGILIKLKAKPRFPGYFFWSYLFLVGLSQGLLASWRLNRVYWKMIPLRQVIWLSLSFWFLARLYGKEKSRWQISVKSFLIKSGKSLRDVKTSFSKRKRI